jgi:hypothetical protein
MAEEYRFDGWQVDKRISIGHMLSIASVLAVMAAWWFQIEGRIERAENRISVIEQHLVEAQTRQSAQNADIIRRLEVIDERIVEHLRRHADKQ